MFYFKLFEILRWLEAGVTGRLGKQVTGMEQAETALKQDF
ncbi:hypothetical protein DYBT9275_03792 [Dyadobacter sp. CECT 9275]|uniref:Uncharacterized protein n=1 Tax=Dyadobacter helix TaxID=2822344 RepID=A0A916NMF8_9BACT|nr:hypothetical protein DYBT9275_03792 [Dyadobacter sp. CECT 9275]